MFKDWNLDKDLRVIAEHKYRTGNYQAGETFSKEATIGLTEEFKNQFRELNLILQEIKDKKVDLALKWAKAQQVSLEKVGSDLLFELHKTQFC